jgi:hypothetical protein
MDTTNSFQQAAENASTGVRNSDEMLKASQRLDKAREATKQRVGIVNVAVDFVREARECE